MPVADFAFRYQEINLHSGCGVITRGIGKEEQFVSADVHMEITIELCFLAKIRLMRSGNEKGSAYLKPFRNLKEYCLAFASFL